MISARPVPALRASDFRALVLRAPVHLASALLASPLLASALLTSALVASALFAFPPPATAQDTTALDTTALDTTALDATARNASAQNGARLTLRDVSVSADTVSIGDRFELLLTIDLAPGTVAFLPDSLLGRGFAPFEPVAWTTTGGQSTGLRLNVVYSLIAFDVGPVRIPEFEVYAADARQSVSAGLSTAGAVVGSFDGFIANPESTPSARLRTVAGRGVYVVSVLLMEDVSAGLQPRPAADVSGADRNWLWTLLGLTFGGLLAGLVGVTTRDLLRRDPIVPLTPSARSTALAALDELLSSGAHRDGHVREFFSRSSEITRRYVEAFDARWGPAWTSTELMDGLREQPSGQATTGLDTEMASAEMVKFGGRRPESVSAEDHWRAVHHWIEQTAEPNADAPRVNAPGPASQGDAT
jgi:hypothetical protein